MDNYINCSQDFAQKASYSNYPDQMMFTALNPNAPTFYPSSIASSSTSSSSLTSEEAEEQRKAELSKIQLIVSGDGLDALVQITGFPLTQENGTRFFGPHPKFKNSEPPRGSEIFVGRLPKYLNESDIYPVFQVAGKIHQIRLLMHFNGSNRGYCFIVYSSPEEAKRAIELLNCLEIVKGHRLAVTLSVDNKTLYFGRLPRDKGREEIFQELGKITNNLVNVIVPPPRMFSPYYPPFPPHPEQLSWRKKNWNKPPAKNRGYVFAQYATHRDAAVARRKLITGNFPLWGKDFVVDWGNVLLPHHYYF